MLSKSFRGVRGRKRYPFAGVVRKGSRAVKALYLGLDKESNFRPSRKVGEDILSGKNGISPGIRALGSNEKTNSSNTKCSHRVAGHVVGTLEWR